MKRELKKFLELYNVEYQSLNGEDVVLLLFFNELIEFSRILAPSDFDDEGIECYLKHGYVAVKMADLLAKRGYTLEEFFEVEGRTYDIIFHDEKDSNSKGFAESYEYCKSYIETGVRTMEGYFGDYAGGRVSIVCNETGEEVFDEDIPCKQ